MRYNKLEAKSKSHYILKRFFLQFAINDDDVSAWKSNRKCHSIFFLAVSSFWEVETWKSPFFEEKL